MTVYKSVLRGRPMVATSPIVPIGAENSTFGCSRSAAEILFRSPRDQGTIGSQIGRRMANTLRIVPRKGTVGYMLSLLSEVRDSNGRSHLSAIIPSGHRTAPRCCFRLILL